MRALLIASAIIAGLGVAAPIFFERLSGRVEDGRAQEARPASPRPQAVLVRAITIKAAADGHFYVDADINLRPVRLVVDTGATVVALRRSDAAAVGIHVFPGQYDHPVSTANGVVRAAQVELDNIAVADVRVSRVPALVLPDEKLAVSLLGGSFLNRLARFEVRDGTLIFEK